MKVQYLTKVLTNTLGEEYIQVKKSWRKSDFVGNHNLQNSDIFPAILARLVKVALEGRSTIKLSDVPESVLIEGEGLFKTVTIGL